MQCMVQSFSMNKLSIALILLLCVFAGGIGYLWYTLSTLEKTSAHTESELRETIRKIEDVVATTTARVTMLETLLTETQTLLQETIDEKDNLSDDLRQEKNRNEEFEDQIDKIGSTVGQLDKLSKTDPELLMKYSKVYFLNEHYMPEKLVEINKAYLYSEVEPKFINAKVAPFLKNMLEDALEDGVKIWVTSAFRSFDTQKDLKSAYTVSYGSGANTFAADQGYSEHQLGTTVDITTEGLGGGIDGFDTTPAYLWMQENAHKYGFVLSYPKNNAYYMFEPWHWRFVGQDLAADLHTDGKFFYDLEQRDIDKYLISIFD